MSVSQVTWQDVQQAPGVRQGVRDYWIVDPDTDTVDTVSLASERAGLAAAFLLLGAALVLLTVFPEGLRGQEPGVLDAARWRADLEQIDRELRSTHPRPFTHVEEAEYRRALTELADEIPALDDHAIMLRMAELVGRIEDGHTRLALPRSPAGLAFSYSHSDDPGPSDPRLALGQLPVSLAALPGGLYVERATDGYEAYVGRRVVGIGGLEAEEALSRVEPLVSAENEGGHRLNAADLLEAPEVVSFVEGRVRECGVPVRLEGPDGATSTVCWTALPDDAAVPAAPERAPYRTVVDSTRGLVVFELNEITSRPDPTLGAAVTEAVRRAEADDVPLVVDLRRNTGGDNTYARIVTLAVLRSPEVNAYGRFFVLVGPRTFSAAQSLLNELERFTRVLFVGEPSGSRPDQFGDSRRVRLENSGLTLRVSTLHWSSGTADDPRTATRPHLPAPRTAAALRGPEDTALEAAAGYRYPGLADLVASQLRRGAVFNAANAGVLDASGRRPELTVDDWLDLARRLADEGEDRAAAYALQIGLFAHPGDERLEEALRARQAG